ncbi:MAG: hypothetical protein H7039_00380 [Bryobacteraceae bacterium]|nr:hypothetical protein [Bryobacteraceae bacterium]
MNCRGNAILATLLFVAAGTESFAQTVTWTAGRTLRIDFVMPAAAWPLAPNTLATYGGYATIVQPHTRMTGVLYNGATVMGVSQSVYSNVRPGLYSFYPLGPSFKSPGSPYNFPRDGEPAVVDFTPIWNKTIQGRLEYTIDTGNIQINLGSVALALSESAGPNYGQSIYPSPQILSVKMLPEVPTDPPPPPPVVPGPPMMSGDDDIFMTPSVLKSWCESTKGTAILVRTNLTVKGSSTTPVQIASGCKSHPVVPSTLRPELPCSSIPLL